MDRGRNYAKRISSGLRFAIAGLLALLALSLSAIHQVIAAPVEYFYLQANVQDAAAPYSFGVMDAHDANGALTGFIQLNEPAASDYQLWAELADNAGVHIQNKATGLCIGDTIGNSGTATLLSCNLGETLWREVPHGPGPKSVAFQRTTKLSWPSSDIEVCLGKDRDAPSTANVYGCSKTISDYEVWTATNEPIGTASAGVTPTPPPPVVPPLRPTGCTVSGNRAVCGLVTFSCHPFSASDKMVVSSGSVGVAVTAVQPNLGLVLGNYINQGDADVAVCATESGINACDAPIKVSFGPTLCTWPTPTPQPHCPISNPECHPE